MNLKFYWLALENCFNSISIFIYEVFTLGKFSWFWKTNKKLEISYDNLIYGETPFITMKHILEKAGAEENLNRYPLKINFGTSRGVNDLSSSRSNSI